MYLELVSISGH